MPAPTSHRRHAFTLVELLSVCAIIAIILTLFLYYIISAREQARVAQCASQLRAISGGCHNYALIFSGSYPLHGDMREYYNNMAVDPTITWDPALPAASQKQNAFGCWWGNPTYTGYGHDDNDAYAGPYLPTSLARTLCVVEPIQIKSPLLFWCPNQRGYTNYGGNSFAANPSPNVRFPGTGYYAFNGNSPGYMWPTTGNTAQDTTNDTNYRIKCYAGRPVYGEPPTRKFNVPTTSFAAGFLTDPPNSILLADRASCDTAALTWNIGTRNFFNQPDTSHDNGFNTLYNDGHVSWYTFKRKVDSANLIVLKSSRYTTGAVAGEK